MPLYEMQCEACGHQDEVLVKSPTSKLPKTCPVCKKRKYKRTVTAPTVHMYWSPMHPRAKRGKG